ncbi:Sialoadhesin [Labeo rohita]|uniref:Sialoadhesin n=1 Tax=Labeo rohita TaxID=84645 RepID=A0ABQ8L206_LABRO|nr:Sialoadhesin [Labeo rohita]
MITPLYVSNHPAHARPSQHILTPNSSPLFDAQVLISNIYSGHTEERPKAKVTIKPAQHVFNGETTWLTEGDSVTLICEVNGSSTGWTFSWFTVTGPSDYSNHHNLLSDSSRGAGGNYTVSSAALNHTGVYVCRAERGKPAYNTQYSNTQLIWVTAEFKLNHRMSVSPPVSLIISPNRTQHFTSVSVSLSCEDQSDTIGWRVRRNTDKYGLEDCSSSVWGSQTGSTCKIITTSTWDTGVYWSDVILESPVHPVTEGDTLTLHCLHQHTTPPNLRADFYKDESLIQSQTTEMIISTVSKSHEGFYYCKHPERGESPKSWISVTASSRRSGSDGLNPVIVGVSAGLTVTFFISVFLVLLWCYRNNKGGRSQSPSSVSQQQNSSQTSEQNQSETGNKTLMSDIVSGATELTYADIELKSTEKQKKKKENKGKTSESSDTVYSKLNLVTHQGRFAVHYVVSSQRIYRQQKHNGEKDMQPKNTQPSSKLSADLLWNSSANAATLPAASASSSDTSGAAQRDSTKEDNIEPIKYTVDAYMERLGALFPQLRLKEDKMREEFTDYQVTDSKQLPQEDRIDRFWGLLHYFLNFSQLFCFLSAIIGQTDHLD